MQMCRNLLYLHMLLWIIRDSNGQRGFCHGIQPDVRICTGDAVTTKKEVFIDTVNVPKFQQTSCECIITPFGIDAPFDFAVVYGHTSIKNMQFKVNDLALNEHFDHGITHLTGETKLYFSALGKNRTGGSCLRVLKEDGSNFSITCIKSQEHTTAPSIITTSAKFTRTRLFSTPAQFTSKRQSITSRTDSSISSTAKTVTDTSTEANARTGLDHDKMKFNVEVIIPVTILSIVCLVLLAAVILLCSRRNRPQRQVFDNSKPVVEQEAVDNCYRHDNPMYDATETQTNVEPSEYHYIQHGEHDARLSTGHYESVPDSQFRKQLPANLENCGQHYDYTTCVKTSKEKGNIAETETTNTANTRNGAELPRDMVTSDNVYDRTDKAAAKQFFNLSSSKMCRANTYDTAGNVSAKEGENEGSVYDVANFH